MASAGGTGKQTAAGAPPSADSQEKALKFAQCMRENGVDMPDPDGSGKMTMTFDAPQDKVQAAQETRRQYVPSGCSGFPAACLSPRRRSHNADTPRDLERMPSPSPHAWIT
ncbi:hypothetical protein MF672_007860 [Actinomadura sp. ATCC 31491]|uniref:Uncharacterized protein n=1 Tax=Actinomadura luzonensis TaxID=2805427 RepID=A0ABT0FMZ0_9ACTN|nr:hypothetical protein [Actinomadura luzonensis]MCK2213700.1 hypothetical protein [Actinomadura luzonensis]